MIGGKQARSICSTGTLACAVFGSWARVRKRRTGKSACATKSQIRNPESYDHPIRIFDLKW